jgi:phage-related minor tail protein
VSDTSLVFNLVAREQVSETLGKVKEKFDAVATGIAAGVAGGLAAGVAQSLDMSAANAKLAAQLGVGPAEAAKLSKASADVYANAWGDSSETVNEAIRGVYQNIGDASKAKGGLEGLTTKALALAETFDQEVGPTTTAVGQMLKTGLAKNADEAFDIIARGFQSGVNKSDDFLDTLNEYSTQFRDLGLDGATATGILKQGLQAGARDADLVADAMKELNIRVQDQSAAKGLKSLGLNAHDMAEAFAAGGPRAKQALQTITDRLRAVEDPTKRYALAQQLLGTQSEDLSKALYAIDPSKAVESLGKVDGAAAGVTKTLAESPAKTLEKFKRTVMVKLAEVGGVFLQFATDHQGVMVPLAYTLGGIAAAVLAIKAGMMVWTAAQTAWTAATSIATGVQWLWNAAMAANPMVWVVVAIIALVAAIVLVATKTTFFQDVWSATWEGLKTGTKAAVDWIMDALSWLGGLPGKFAGWFGTAKDWAVAKMAALVSWVTGLPGRLWNALAGLAGSLRDRASSAFQSMKDAAITRATSIVTWLTGLPGRFGRAVGNMAGTLYNKGQDVIRGLWNGIASMGGWLWSQVTNFVKNNVVDAAKSFLHIGSPSKLVADEIGHWIPAGVAQGVENNAGVVDQAMKGLVDPGVYRPAVRSAGMSVPVGAAGGAQRTENRLVLELRGGSRAFREFFQESVRVTAGGDVIKFAQG